jgi:hypothetical protein
MKTIYFAFAVLALPLMAFAEATDPVERHTN